MDGNFSLNGFTVTARVGPAGSLEKNRECDFSGSSRDHFLIADIPIQLRTALDKVAFLPFGLLIDKWRWQVFSGKVKPEDYNKAWWALHEEYQGVAPPVARTEADFDRGAKNHIPANVPYARYYLARIYQFQFYKAMCEAAGYKGPLNRCSFFGSKAAGGKLAAMLKAGASQP